MFMKFHIDLHFTRYKIKLLPVAAWRCFVFTTTGQTGNKDIKRKPIPARLQSYILEDILSLHPLLPTELEKLLVTLIFQI